MMNRIYISIAAWLLFAAILACGKPPVHTGGEPSVPNAGEHPELEIVRYTEADENGDMIPDFSRVGYHWSDKDIPIYDVVAELEAPSDGSDATLLIQNAINSTSGGAILLKKGIYNIYGQIYLKKSNVVLRGEGNKETILVAKGKSQRTLISLGMGAVKRTLIGTELKIEGEYIPMGTYLLELSGANPFKKGDKVVISWIPDANWISALKMDKIPPRADGIAVQQWTPEAYKLYWERTVRASGGRFVYLENPVAMPLDARYGRAYLQAYNYLDRISESGIENMILQSDFASDEDENHSWTAIEVSTAEHCWVKDVESRYFAFGCVDLKSGAKNISVLSCICRDPKAQTIGSRKYGFYFSDCQQCIVKDCKSYGSRHGFSSSARVSGPNVFLRCEEIDGKSGDCGPHMRWASCILYDNVKTNQSLKVQDRNNMGSGHGWAGTTHIFWNCSASRIVCQSPWVGGKNYCIACIGTKDEGNFKGRPDGVWISHNVPEEPLSLYEQQLENRRKIGLTTLPADL